MLKAAGERLRSLRPDEVAGLIDCVRRGDDDGDDGN
jgi:hypothetical protein